MAMEKSGRYELNISQHSLFTEQLNWAGARLQTQGDGKQDFVGD